MPQGLGSWLRSLRGLGTSSGHACLELRGGFVQFARHLAQKFGATPLGFRRDLGLNVFANASQLFVEAPANVFEVVHKFRSAHAIGRGKAACGTIPVL